MLNEWVANAQGSCTISEQQMTHFDLGQEGAMTLSITTLSIMGLVTTLSITVLSAIMLSVVMLSVAIT